MLFIAARTKETVWAEMTLFIVSVSRDIDSTAARELMRMVGSALHEKFRFS
jgi:hypothetical protein